MKNYLLLLFFILSLFGFLACSSSESTETDQRSVTLKRDSTVSATKVPKNDLLLMRVKPTHTERYTALSGRVIPRNRTELFAEVQGRIMSGGVSFKNGISFSEGDILLLLDDSEFRLGLEAQRSAFLNTLTSLMPDMKSDYPESYPHWLKYIQNYTNGRSLPPLPKPLSDREKYYVTSYQVYSEFYKIKSQEERLSKYRILAPYSGMITNTMIDVGSLVSPGQRLGTIINRHNYELEAGLDIATSQHLKIGDQLKFTSNNTEGSWSGKLIRKNNIIDPSTQNIPVYFRLSGKGITPGMYLESAYRSRYYENVTVLPTEAIQRDDKVLVLQGDAIKSKPIELVEFMTDSVIVRGLSADDLVILNDFSTPMLGKKVSL